MAKKGSATALFILVLALVVSAPFEIAHATFAEETHRINFRDKETFTYADSRRGGNIKVEWVLDIDISVNLPVDIAVSGYKIMEPSSKNEVQYKLLTPKDEGEIEVTATGIISVTGDTYTGQAEAENTTSLSVTTPFGEWEVSFPIPIPVQVGSFVIVTIVPTLYINASMKANAIIQGSVIVSDAEQIAEQLWTRKLSWNSNEEVEVVTINALKEDELEVTATDFRYWWSALTSVAIELEGTTLASKTFPAKCYRLLAEGNPKITFSIEVVPEFISTTLIAVLILTSLVALAIKKSSRRSVHSLLRKHFYLR